MLFDYFNVSTVLAAVTTRIDRFVRRFAGALVIARNVFKLKKLMRYIRSVWTAMAGKLPVHERCR